MYIGILSRNPEIHSTRRLAEACEAHGHKVLIADPLLCSISIVSPDSRVYYRNEPLDGFDAVIPRIGASVTYHGTAVLRQFEMMGVYTLNDSAAISRSRDKLRTFQILSGRGIGLPVTGYAHSSLQTKQLIELVGGPPLVIKLLEGTQGRGVVLAETMQAAENVIAAFRGMDAHFLVQEYIKEAEGSDIRCFVIGDKVTASIMRKASPGEFRSNLHLGGTALPVRITSEERETAVAAVQALGLSVAGVDLIRSRRGPLVIEVNSSPGLEGIEEATGMDIAGHIVSFIERMAGKSRLKTG